MNTPTTLYLHGQVTDLDTAKRVIDRFHAGGVEAALVSTWDGLVTDPTQPPDIGGTRAGWLARASGEVRWRREAERTLVTVLTTEPIPGLEMEQVEAVEVTRGPVTSSRGEHGGLDGRLRRCTYHAADGRVLAARDELVHDDAES